LKAPSRVAEYKRITNNLPLPPRPVLTRWGTWISAALFYCEHYSKIKEVLQSLNPEDAKCIKDSQNSLSDQLLIDLIFIRSNYSMLPATIVKLETRGMKLSESISTFLKFKSDIESVPGKIGDAVASKLNNVLTKNTAFGELVKLVAVLNKTESVEQNEILISPKHWDKFTYAPITSVDVERSFSMYNNVLQDKRESFTPENIEKVVVVYCNTT